MKRLWDTENKKTVWVRVDGKAYQVWTDGTNLYIYADGKWVEYNPEAQGAAAAEEYGPTWKELDDEEVGYYDTNVPTDMYSWDSGDEVAYAFKNGSTVLQSGKIDEGETPEYTGDTPTKTDVKPYITYTFSGWKPTVGPIYKKTDFKAQFTKTEIALQNDVLPNVDGLTMFGDADADSNVVVFTQTDPETGDNTVVVSTLGVFDDDFFVGTYGEENQNGWEYIFLEALVADDLVHLIYEGDSATDGVWKSGIWSALQTYYATPTKANADAVIAAIVATRDSETGQLEPITWTIPEEPVE